MSSSVLLISDLHLRGVDDPNQTAFLHFLDTVPFDELVIVGDLFDIWFVPGASVPVQGVPVIAALLRLVGEGRPVTWIAGNHDWVPGVAVLGVPVVDHWERTVDGKRVVAVHGDEGADPRLRQRLFDRVVHSSVAAAGARALGPAFMWRLGTAVSNWSRGKGHEDLQDVLLRQNTLADRLLTDADVVVVGHSHAPGILPRREGTLVNLGDWLEHRTYARLDGAALRLLHWTGSEEVDVPHGPPHRRPLLLRGAIP